MSLYMNDKLTSPIVKTQGYSASFVGPWKGTHGRLDPQDAAPSPPLFDNEEKVELSYAEGHYAEGVEEEFTKSGHYAKWVVRSFHRTMTSCMLIDLFRVPGAMLFLALPVSHTGHNGLSIREQPMLAGIYPSPALPYDNI